MLLLYPIEEAMGRWYVEQRGMPFLGGPTHWAARPMTYPVGPIWPLGREFLVFLTSVSDYRCFIGLLPSVVQSALGLRYHVYMHKNT